jgi:hypothetical protein
MRAKTANYRSADSDEPHEPRVESRTDGSAPNRSIRLTRLRFSAVQRITMQSAIRLGKSTGSLA